MLSCEFSEISKNTFSYRTSPAAASENLSNTEPELKKKCKLIKKKRVRENKTIAIFIAVEQSLFLNDSLCIILAAPTDIFNKLNM